MKYALALCLIVTLGATAWFYEMQYLPLVSTSAEQAGKISSLSAQVAAAKTQTDSLNSQLIALSETNLANSAKIADLESQRSKSIPNQSFVAPDALPAQPNWTWSVLGKDYHNVVVLKVEADCVHVSYDGGTGALNLADLPPDLQKMFNYNPSLAAQAIQAKAANAAKVDAEQAPLIAAEQQREHAQAAADENERQAAMRSETARGIVGDAQDQKRIIQSDISQMVAAHEITISTDPKTGAVYIGGTPYWKNKYYADTAAIAKCDQQISTAGR